MLFVFQNGKLNPIIVQKITFVKSVNVKSTTVTKISTRCTSKTVIGEKGLWSAAIEENCFLNQF